MKAKSSMALARSITKFFALSITILWAFAGIADGQAVTTAAGDLLLSGGLTASSGSFANGITASSGTFLATGVATYSIVTSSAINILAGGVVWPDGTVSTTAASVSVGGGSGGIPSIQVFNANGTFVVPAGVTKIIVEVWGGGGAGGSSSVLWGTGAGGGGAGGYGKDTFTVAPGDSYTVTVGGAGATSSISGTAGTVSASGGSNGTTGTGGYGPGGAGGTSTATINISGASGCGGSAAGGQGGTAGGGGGGGGGGGIGSTVALDTGKPGSTPGGGGGGSGGGVTTTGGGSGGSGRVIVMY